MIAIQPSHLPARLKDVYLLARLLERLEHSHTEVAPTQYLQVVRGLERALQDVPRDAALHKMLDVFPAATELYENLRHDDAGPLCRTPRALASSAQTLARRALDEAAAQARLTVPARPARRTRRR